MPRTRHGLVRALLVIVLVVLAGCGDSDQSSGPDSAPATTATPSTAAAPPTTAAPSAGPVADGSGCTPGSGDLPDGRWFGYVTVTRADGLDLDLACWFSGEAAIEAAAEDGEESPPPNDYYVRNDNLAARSLAADPSVEVLWYPDLGDPTSEATTTFADWVAQDRGAGGVPGIWVEIDDGSVVSIHEQWVP
jgi:hypothetical protein